MEPVKAYSDIVVKYILGREETKDILLEFINAVLLDAEFDEIKEIEINNPFNIKEFEEDKNSILDIKATDIHGKIYNLEIQSLGDSSYINRTLYYWARLYSSQIKDADRYTRIKPVICINLLNFKLVDATERFHTCYLLI